MIPHKDRATKKRAWKAPRVMTFEAGLAENFNVNKKDGGGLPGTNQS